jgi:glycosyltransferase involved in cell wall biosynthesis
MKDIKSLRAIKIYLERYSSGPVEGLPEPDPDLFLSIVIPAFKEENIEEPLKALLNCRPPDAKWEIIVHINHSLGASEEIINISLRCRLKVQEIAAAINRPDTTIHTIYTPDLPNRYAGVGLARKIGMDAAVRRFYKVDRPEGVIAAFDADAVCSEDYLEELIRFFKTHPKAATANIHFEHPLDGSLPDPVYRAAMEYELYLRYYRQALRSAGHPHAIHTVGSSFAVRASAYCRAGGMGKHLAGEDFYFLHKCILLGGFYEISSARVFPSPRESDRVLFGTGASVRKHLTGSQGFGVFNLDAFLALKPFFARVPGLFYEGRKGGDLTGIILEDLHPVLQTFLAGHNVAGQITALSNNTASEGVFLSRFFAWFNGLMVLRYLNESHKDAFKKKPVRQEANRLAGIIDIEPSEDTKTLLENYRNFEKSKGIVRIT